MNTIKIDKYFKGMIANRGLSGIETENTIFAFLAASNRSYYGISCDVALSKDDKLIVIYDDTLLRLGLLNIYIPSFAYEELKKFALVDRKTLNLDNNLFIPTLSDFLAICKTYRKQSFIKINNNMKNESLNKIIAEVEEHYNIKNVEYISNNKKHLTHLAKKVNKTRIYYDALNSSIEVFEFCKNHGFNLNLKHEDVTKDIVKNMHLFGLKVSTGVVNDKETAEKLIKLGVDFVFTDILE